MILAIQTMAYLHCHIPKTNDTLMTNEDNIIVDEILASCYPFSVDHNMAHIGMVPIRWFPDIMHMVFGEDNALSVFIKINEELGL